LHTDVLGHYETYSYHLVVQRIHNFCVNQLGGIYLDIIKDRQYTTQQDSEIRRSAQTAMKIITDHLVVLISPILSFTAEEIWQTSASLSNKAQSVFLTSFEGFNEFTSDLSPESWSRFLHIKEEVNQSIEDARSAGHIKGSLDASIQVILEEDDFKILEKFSSELHFFFIVSDCQIVQGKIFSVSVSKSSAEKCTRCWHRNNSVGQSNKHPELCSRCELNLDGPGEDRKFA